MKRFTVIAVVGLAVLCFAVQAQAALTSYWTFDDGTGLTATNSGTSGHTYDGRCQN